MARNYLKGVKRGFKPEHFDEAVEFGKKYAAEKLTRDVIPFKGSRKDKIRGLGPFVARWLTGDKNVAGELISADELLEGGGAVDITRAGKKGEFRNEFTNRIVQAGSRIMQATDKRKIIKRESVLTCQMVNKYKRQDIEPFAPTCLPRRPSGHRQDGKLAQGSYLRFVVINNHLYLDIQVAQK